MSDKEKVFLIDKIRKSYGGKIVLDVGELSIERGYIYALIGPNGAGKSTLLRQLNLLDEAEEREMKFLDFSGQDLKNRKLEVQRKMTLVFQKPVLFNTSVFENIAYGLSVRGYTKKETRVEVLKALRLVGLEEKVDQRATTLSGGEAQRLALARAIVIKPEVLLLDEPTANLDPQSGLEVERLIKRINEETKTTIVMVTHNMFQAKRLAHKGIFLMGGKVVEKGTVEELFERPQAAETKAFIRGDIVF